MFSISLVIPAYNEELGILKALEDNAKVLCEFGIDYEIIVINDGSEDSTQELINTYKSDNPNTLIHNKKNGGFGSAIKFGIEKCTKEYVLCVPVDSPLTKDVFQSFFDNFGKADILVGFRKKRLGYSSRMLFNSWLFHKLIFVFFRMNLKDYTWIHAYKRSIFNKIEIEYNGIFMLAEVLIKAKRNNYSIIEFPVEMIKRSGGVATAGSWKAAWETFRDFFVFLFSK